MNLKSVRIVVELDFFEATNLRYAAGQIARRKERSAKSNNFVPEPGRMNLDVERAKACRSAARKLDTALMLAIEKIQPQT
jgi:hypothetical protein